MAISPDDFFIRQQRLLDAYRNRTIHREEIISRRQEKDEIFLKLKQEREEEYNQRRFVSSLRLADKRENVERVARQNEFHRLQTMRAIAEADRRYEKIQEEKRDILKRHNEESKYSLTRKHMINNAMDMMRVTNDYSLLDKLFNENKRGKKRGEKVRGGGGYEGDGEGEDPRLNQTI